MQYRHRKFCNTNSSELSRYLNSWCILHTNSFWKNFFKKNIFIFLYFWIKISFSSNFLTWKFFIILWTIFFRFLSSERLSVFKNYIIIVNHLFSEYFHSVASNTVIWTIFTDLFLMKSECLLIASETITFIFFLYLISRLYFWNFTI